MTTTVSAASTPTLTTASTSSSNNKQNADEQPKKIVIRRLPPTLTKEQFLEVVSPLPDHDYMYYCKSDNALGQFAFSRAYICFAHLEDVFVFKEKFDNYVFVDSKSNEYPACVEFAPYQRKLRNQTSNKKDSKCSTIEQDTEYMKFCENLEKQDGEQLPSCEVILEQIEQREKEMQNSGGLSKQSTPLLDFLRKKKDDKKQARDRDREMRKKRDDERRKRRDDDDDRRKNDYYGGGGSGRSYGKSGKDGHDGSSTAAPIKIMSKASSSNNTTKSATSSNATGSTNTTNSQMKSNSASSNNNNRYDSASKSGTASQQSKSNNVNKASNSIDSKRPVKETTPTPASNASGDGANKISASSNPTAAASKPPSSAASNKSEDDRRDKTRNRDRPSIQIYNPAERAAQRRQQQQPTKPKE